MLTQNHDNNFEISHSKGQKLKLGLPGTVSNLSSSFGLSEPPENYQYYPRAYLQSFMRRTEKPWTQS